MDIIDLRAVDETMTELVGGKAARLGALMAAGERVPAGFCVTTRAHRRGEIPRTEVLDAYRALDAAAVAVRSSATAEDLPTASFAGQQDTILNVTTEDELLDAISRCWDSLWNDRATAYRAAQGIDSDSVSMGVVVQAMVRPRAAGVLFTANPVTGCRDESVVDAAPGLGTAVVDGSQAVEHYILPIDSAARAVSGSARVLDNAALELLESHGQRLSALFGAPQDIEWAIDVDGTLWSLQSRDITTLFPVPGDNGRPPPRVFMEAGNMQGMLRPFTPMGMSLLQLVSAYVWRGYGVATDPVRGPAGMADIGGRLYLDLTDFVRSRSARRNLGAAMSTYGPRVAGAFGTVLEDPRFTPTRRTPFRLRGMVNVTARVGPAAIVGIIRALTRPPAARTRAFDAVAALRDAPDPPDSLDTASRLRFAEETQRVFLAPEMNRVMWPLATGIIVGMLPRTLLRGIATEAEIDTALGGLPHNVTTEMDLALWRLADAIEPGDQALFRDTPPGELAARYRGGTLPDIGLADFLQRYGHRAAGEIDVGVPRWSQDPAPVFATIANYLRVNDPEASAPKRFDRARDQAEAMIAELARRARQHPVRGRVGVFLLRRARQLTGLRELGKFAWLYSIAQSRRQLLRVGDDLVRRGLLDRAEDIMFLDVTTAREAVAGHDHRELITRRRRRHESELRRRHVPILLLSDGTDVETLAPAPGDGQSMRGMAAAPGEVTARARVVRDPGAAHVEPGEILVAATTDPGWTPLFMTAGGLVTETGAMIAHGPTVAREYGIPAVICVPRATERIATGDMITVDGSTGTVSVIDSDH